MCQNTYREAAEHVNTRTREQVSTLERVRSNPNPNPNRASKYIGNPDIVKPTIEDPSKHYRQQHIRRTLFALHTWCTWSKAVCAVRCAKDAFVLCQVIAALTILPNRVRFRPALL